jgi:putative tryptophan/tyrosine transport system substrate-binding protein
MNILFKFSNSTASLRLCAKYSCFVLLLCASFARPAFAASCEAVVVKSADLKPYRDAARGVRDSCSCFVRETMLREGESADKLLGDADAVVAIGTAAFRKAAAIRTRPVVHALAMPSEADRLTWPNVSGVGMDPSPDEVVAALAETFPGAKRIGLLYDPRNTKAFVNEATRAARSAGLELVALELHAPSDFGLLVGALRDRIDVFWMLPDPTVVTDETVGYLLRFSFEHNLPVFSFSRKYVEMGAVAALDASPYDMGVQAGELVNALVKGRKGPVRVSARAAQLTINRKVADKMGVRLGAEALKRGRTIE